MKILVLLCLLYLLIYLDYHRGPHVIGEVVCVQDITIAVYKFTGVDMQYIADLHVWALLRK